MNPDVYNNLWVLELVQASCSLEGWRRSLGPSHLQDLIVQPSHDARTRLYPFGRSPCNSTTSQRNPASLDSSPSSQKPFKDTKPSTHESLHRELSQLEFHRKKATLKVFPSFSVNLAPFFRCYSHTCTLSLGAPMTSSTDQSGTQWHSHHELEQSQICCLDWVRSCGKGCCDPGQQFQDPSL